MRKLIYLSVILLIYCQPKAEKGFTSYVNPFIGTGGKGHTYPGATVPFGMVQLSPDNGIPGWDRISGYHYEDSLIAGFSHTHLSGTGIGDLYDISFFPFDQSKKQVRYEADSNMISPYYSKFSHEKEKATPGFYSVFLDDYKIKARLTATERCGFHSYEYPDSSNPAVFVDLARAMNWDKTMEAEIKVEGDSIISGYRFSEGWAKNQKTFFYAVISEKMDGYEYEKEGEFPLGRLILNFTPGLKCLRMKVGISHVSINQARLNLEKEIPHWDFDLIGERADFLWEQELGKIQAEFSHIEEKVVFYTSLYQSMLAPTVMSDVNGKYRGFDDKIHQSDQRVYSTFSLWDTFRAAHPLYTLLHEKRTGEMVRSMMAQYEQTGVLPVWPLINNETNCMIGVHSIPVITDAFMKGLTDYEPRLLLEAMESSMNQDKEELKYYKENGFIPEKIHNSVSKQLEYCFDDWCIAQLQDALKRTEKRKEYDQRAMSFTNLFDSSTCFFRGKNENGEWITPFSGDDYTKEYMESNAWHYLFFTPHAAPRLVELMGGKDKFISMLDSMFQKGPEADDKLPVFSTGMIGQYVHGNEPDHHVPYLYQYADSPHKTEKMTRKIMKELYFNQPDGICGNEDCGQMASWFVFSAMGFYPVNPASGKYVFGSPLITSCTVSLPNEKTLVIEAKNQSPENIYVEKIMWNDKETGSFMISHDQLIQGGKLTFYMTCSPPID